MIRPPGDAGPDDFAVEPGRYRLRSGVFVVIVDGLTFLESASLASLEDDAVSLGCWGKRFPVRRRGDVFSITLDAAGARMAVGRIERQGAAREALGDESRPPAMTHDEWDRALQRRRKRELYESRRK